MESRKADEESTTIKVASTKNSLAKTPGSRGGAIKLKKSALTLVKAGNWKEAAVVEDDKKKNKDKDKDGAITAVSPSPIVNQLDEARRATFITGRPLEDGPEIYQCKHCKKSVLISAAHEHIGACLRIKKEKAQRKKEAREARERAKEAAREEEARKAGGGEEPDRRDDDDSDAEDIADRKGPNAGKTTGKATGKKTDVAVGGKKRKAETDIDKGSKTKKKKDEPKPKVAKPKGPVDVERQCGVPLPNGLLCARSLTCKSHSMLAKRSVPGRSLPYDMLLTAYQKKNQAKQQKAAIDANTVQTEEEDQNAVSVDSDEETAAVMSALAHWNPQPVVPQPVFAPIKRQYQLARLHEQLQAATNGGRVNIFKVVGFGAQRLPENHPANQANNLYDNDDAQGEPDTAVMGNFSRRSSSFSLSGPPQRRPSVSSRA
ncbi:SCA7, zinc-binding domain-containing protein [Lasiosphaeria miniovina]|uniref:SCA7, zinc-binding domain-containing protein n=1 Tax=Lasiosphaeria miniovina TaxID=1954250 RepID=A0AA40AUW7_9PEZI|nr:SCA7, zinc-binding domain-containing protein [Lasiosphaeria miniovina]KAK0722475.1 SCA7, zinc-binding domain-containing protein [Lasiosphaeria miniovina]